MNSVKHEHAALADEATERCLWVHSRVSKLVHHVVVGRSRVSVHPIGHLTPPVVALSEGGQDVIHIADDHWPAVVHVLIELVRDAKVRILLLVGPCQILRGESPVVEDGDCVPQNVDRVVQDPVAIDRGVLTVGPDVDASREIRHLGVKCKTELSHLVCPVLISYRAKLLLVLRLHAEQPLELFHQYPFLILAWITLSFSTYARCRSSAVNPDAIRREKK